MTNPDPHIPQDEDFSINPHGRDISVTSRLYATEMSTLRARIEKLEAKVEHLQNERPDNSYHPPDAWGIGEER